jgi:hypothetical protein
MTEQSMVRLLRADKGNQPVFIYLVHLCRRDAPQITRHDVRALQNDKVHIIGRASRRALFGGVRTSNNLPIPSGHRPLSHG